MTPDPSHPIARDLMVAEAAYARFLAKLADVYRLIQDCLYEDAAKAREAAHNEMDVAFDSLERAHRRANDKTG